MKYQVVFLLTFTILFTNCGEEETAPIVEAIRPVRYAKVTTSNSFATNTFSGTVQSSKEAKLSFKVAGTINNLKVKVGDKVRSGQVIASLDAIDYSIDYDRAVANMKNSETQIKSAETQRVTTKSSYERIEKLYENNSVPLSDYEQAKAAYEAAESQYDAAQAGMTAARKQTEAAKNQVNYARLTAPFNGIITAVNVEENELVGSGNPIAILSAESRPEVRVGIPESFIAQIRKGQKVDIQFSISPDKIFTGIISEVAFSSSEASTYPVIVQIDNPGSDIRPGMATNVTFYMGHTKKQEAALIAPAKSIGQDTKGNYAFLIEKDGEHYIVKKAVVEIGRLMPEGFEIKSGIKDGELVATAGLKSLLDGMKVRLLEE